MIARLEATAQSCACSQADTTRRFALLIAWTRGALLWLTAGSLALLLLIVAAPSASWEGFWQRLPVALDRRLPATQQSPTAKHHPATWLRRHPASNHRPGHFRDAPANATDGNICAPRSVAPVECASYRFGRSKDPSSDSSGQHHDEEFSALAPVDLQSLKPFRWLHVPKTSTSFINTLVRRACEQRDGGSRRIPAWAAVSTSEVLKAK